MDISRVNRGELIAIVGGAVLALSLFLEWYSLGNLHAAIGSSCKGPNSSCTGLDALGVLGYLLLLASIAPLILAYIIIRGHALSWPRGELTAVTALTALTLTLFRGFIDKPGNPPGQISISYGWWLGLLGGVLILIGSIARSQDESANTRKPPGVL